jgi:uncharacterized protein YjdB
MKKRQPFFLLPVILIFLFLLSSSVSADHLTYATQPGRIKVSGTVRHLLANQVGEKINAERSKNGLYPLHWDRTLTWMSTIGAAELSFGYGKPCRPGGAVYTGIVVDVGIIPIDEGYYLDSDRGNPLEELKTRPSFQEALTTKRYNGFGFSVFENTSGDLFWYLCLYYKSRGSYGGEPYTADAPLTITLEASPKVIDNLIIEPDSKGLAPGVTKQLQIRPDNLSTVLDNSAWTNWTSSNPSIASVDSAGRLTAHQKGTVTISVTNIEDPNFIVKTTLNTSPEEVLPPEKPVDVSASGSLTSTLSWKLAKGTLTLTGTGEIPDLVVFPWETYQESILEIKIADSITGISQGAFRDLPNLCMVTIGSGVTHIDNTAFHDCPKLALVYFNGPLPRISYSFGVSQTSRNSSVRGYHPSYWNAVPASDDYGAAWNWISYHAEKPVSPPPSDNTDDQNSGQTNPGTGNGQTDNGTKPPTVTGVKLNRKSLTLTAGASYTLKATVSPANASNRTVTWHTGNKKTTSVSKNGKVKALSPGTTLIKVKTKNGKTASCKLTVKPKTPSQLKVKKAGNGKIKLTWKKVSQASGYYIYRKTPGSKWKRIASTSKTYYYNKNLKKGKKYSYTVAAYKKIGKKRLSGNYSKKGVTIRMK